MKKLNILITGGAGYLGSMITTKLVEDGHNVTVIDILEFNKTSLAHLFIKHNFKFIEGDVRDKNLISRELINKNIIIPLAALVGAPLCEKYPKQTIDINDVAQSKIVNKGVKKNKDWLVNFDKLKGDVYYTSNFSDEFKLVFNEKSLGLYLKETSDLVQISRGALIKAHEFLNRQE